MRFVVLCSFYASSCFSALSFKMSGFATVETPARSSWLSAVVLSLRRSLTAELSCGRWMVRVCVHSRTCDVM